MYFIRLLREAQFHGAKLLAEKKHRLHWIILLLLLLCCANCLLIKTVYRYLENPTRLLKLNSETSMMAFPKVLVCPEIDYPKHRVDAFLHSIKYPRNINKTRVKLTLSQLAAFYAPDKVYSLEDLKVIEQVLKYNDMDVLAAAGKLSTSCKETLIKCRLFDGRIDCSALFHMEITSYGFCCVFNGRSLKREMATGNYSSNYQNKVTKNIGFISKLVMAVNQSQELSPNVDLSYKWLVIEKGNSYVDQIINGTPITPNKEVWAQYSQIELKISDDARKLSFQLRKCRNREEKLNYFPYYEREYCILECEMMLMLQNCGCLKVTHLLPNGTKYCNSSMINCTRSQSVSFAGDSKCDCPPNCNMVADIVQIRAYPLEVKATPFDHLYNGLVYNKTSVIHVTISTRYRKVFSREPYFHEYDLFSQLGGLFSIFFGCSILTLLELIQLVVYCLKDLLTRCTLKNKSKEYANQKHDRIKNKLY